MGNTFLSALALLLVLEGLMPFLAPALWRDTFQRLVLLNDGQLRFAGLASMAVGVVILLATGGS